MTGVQTCALPIYMLTGNGPMFGEQLKTDMLVISNNLGSFEVAMLHLMGLERWNIGHINAAKKMDLIPNSLSDIRFNADLKRYKSRKFFLKRTLQNYIALMGFKSRFITWFGYESIFAKPLHYLLYASRGNPLKKAIRERNNSHNLK